MVHTVASVTAVALTGSDRFEFFVFLPTPQNFFSPTPKSAKIAKKKREKNGDLYKQNRARRDVLTPCQSGRGAKAFSHHPSSRPLAGVNAHAVQAAANFIRVSGTGEVAGGGSVGIEIGVLVSTPALIPYKVPGIIYQESKIHAR